MGKIIQYCLALLLLIPLAVAAETGYVIDRVEVGLHQENSLDSPIVKLLATGAELEILARDERLTQVRDESGTTGWIKNEYLQLEKPTRRLFEEVSSRNQQLKNEINKLKTQLKQAGSDEQIKALTEQNNKLQQEIKSVRLEAGELQAELSELRKATPVIEGSGADDRELYQRIAELEQENITLEETIEQLRNPPLDAGSMKEELRQLKANRGELKRHVFYVLGALLVGLIAGIFLYDLIHRRKHSGFRV